MMSNMMQITNPAREQEKRERRAEWANYSRRVLKDDRRLAGEAELLGSEKEGIREGLASLKSVVIGGDGDLGRGNTDSSHGTMSYTRRRERGGQGKMKQKSVSVLERPKDKQERNRKNRVEMTHHKFEHR